MAVAKRMKKLPLPDNNWLEIAPIKMSVFEEITDEVTRLSAKEKKSDEDRREIKAKNIELNTLLINNWSFAETLGLDPKNPQSYSELDLEDRLAVEKALRRYIENMTDTGN